MCGIDGTVTLDGRPVDETLLRTLNGVITHRGPDDDGFFVAGCAGLAMRRLSIIDVAGSPQPLFNEDRSIALVFNGEIFNYQALRSQLGERGHTFHTDGDGETIAHLYERYGDHAPVYLRGQFAFGLWDTRQQRLLLARDRMGQKPLYYYHDDRTFVFGSEIKSLLMHPDVPRQSALTDPQLLGLYLAYGYLPAPYTPFMGIKMLPPAHTLTLADGQISIAPYWTQPAITRATVADPVSDAGRYIDGLRDLLEEAVKLRLIADVPLGAFLSGGLDSSLIVALMKRHSDAPIKTFSIGFAGDDTFDETTYAEQVAAHLATDHTAFRVQPSAMELLPAITWHYDQPFADSSSIPTYLVSQLTRQHVTVALTGDGGDELFAGYDRFYAFTLLQRLKRIPRPLWRLLAGLIDRLPEGTGYADTVKRAGRFARAASRPPQQAYFDWVRLFDADQVAALTGGDDYATAHFDAQFSGDVTLADILQANITGYLPDDLLIKADRSSMMASLETRAPFMDHHLVEFAATIPLNLKLNGATRKYILKEAARGLLPDAIIDREKHGFGVPLGAWLRRDSQPVRDILLSDTARARHLLNMTEVENLISAHTSGARDHGFRLWSLLALETWHTLFIDPITLTAPATPAVDTVARPLADHPVTPN